MLLLLVVVCRTHQNNHSTQELVEGNTIIQFIRYGRYLPLSSSTALLLLLQYYYYLLIYSYSAAEPALIGTYIF